MEEAITFIKILDNVLIISSNKISSGFLGSIRLVYFVFS